MRELSRNPAKVVAGLRRSKATDTIVTYRGRPIARLLPLTEDEVEQYLLGRLVAGMDLNAPDHRTSRPLEDVVRDLGITRPRPPRPGR
jgi:antitoxin (DNA-binding transcriptional repressor) of toxin-antitoxin stability system